MKALVQHAQNIPAAPGEASVLLYKTVRHRFAEPDGTLKWYKGTVISQVQLKYRTAPLYHY